MSLQSPSKSLVVKNILNFEAKIARTNYSGNNNIGSVASLLRSVFKTGLIIHEAWISMSRSWVFFKFVLLKILAKHDLSSKNSVYDIPRRFHVSSFWRIVRQFCILKFSKSKFQTQIVDHKRVIGPLSVNIPNAASHL